MNPLNCLCSTVLLVLFTLSSQVDSQTIKCNAGYNLQRYCRVSSGTADTQIDRISAEDSRFSCYKDSNYGYVYYSPGQAYIWVLASCGGTFQVQTSGTWNNWSTWTSCNVTCGGGSQTRSRQCNTGNDLDCSSKDDDNVETTPCNTQACITNDVTPIGQIPNCGIESPKFGYKIISGTQAKNCQYPWMVMVYNTLRNTLCGGSIIDSTHILTAAHCLTTTQNGYTYAEKPDSIRVFSGSSEMPFRRNVQNIPGIYVRQLSRFKVHENYNYGRLDNDIAVITLNKPIKFDSCHFPICLPDGNSLQDTSGCKTMGWGVTSNDQGSRVSSQLLQVDIDIQPDRTCDYIFGKYFNSKVKICAGGNNRGSCQGDSGGPLLCKSNDRFYQYGIVSGGAEKRCGKLSSFYTKVSSFLDWIKINTQ